MKEIMKRMLRYLNPMAHLGDKKYPLFFPLLVNILLSVLSEAFAYGIAKDPNIVGTYIIFLNITFIVYFSFRSGIRGGIITTVITILYYGYIIITRNYKGEQLIAGVETTAVLAISYLVVAGVIGWLKETIDNLIESEANEKRRLQAIIQQLPVGIVITDHIGKVLQTNRRVEMLLGAKVPIGFIAGQEILLKTTYNGKLVTSSQSPIVQALSSGKSVVGKEFEVDRPDGKKVHLQISASPIRNKSGKIVAAASILADITQQKELEARKDDFVNMASHELKTPLTSMKLYIDLLGQKIKQTNDDKLIKTVQSIKGQTDRLQELVSDLLDVSRLQTGKLNFNKEEFRMEELIEETIEGLEGAAKNHKIVFIKNIPMKVYADRFRIYQVLTNFITNAIKYSPEGTTIAVSLKRSQGKIIVSVADSGIGIAKEQHRKIFDRLYQVTDSTEKTFPGLGMGLYISKEIVKKHKGDIWVESEKGKGSTFYFSLPLP